MSEFPILTLSDVVAAGAQGLPDDLPTSSYELLRRSAELYGERIALSFFVDVESHRQTRAWTYRDLFDRTTRAANLLHVLGLAKDGVVALLLPNLPETHFALWGGQAAGIAMPVNPLLEPSSIASLLKTAKAEVLITVGPGHPDLYSKAVAVASQTPTLRHIVRVELPSHNGSPRPTGPTDFDVPGQVQVHDLEPALRRVSGDRLTSGRAIAAQDVASYFCTGGTTGQPKIAVQTHGQIVANAWMSRRMLGSALDEESALFCGLPLFHVNAVMVTGMVPFLVGARVVLGAAQGFRTPGLVARFWEIVAHHRLTGFSGVPTLLSSLLEHPADGFDLSCFRFAVCGAAPLSADLLQRFEQTFQVSVVEGYGLTETVCVASMNPVEGEHRAGSVGLPLPGGEIRIAISAPDGAFVRDAETDEIGAVTIAGPHVFSGYLRPEHNSGLWLVRSDGRRWLNTGDLGRIDKDGYLWLTGRAKDLIIRGGHNIDPSIIEDALQSHPDVALAAAVGRPDVYAGEVPVAYVQLRPGAEAREQDLLQHVAARIGERAAIPKDIVLIDAMPLTAVGKIHKPTLRLFELAGAARRALESAGINAAAVDARPDPLRGNVVQIVADPGDEPRIRDALSPFSFNYELTGRPTG